MLCGWWNVVWVVKCCVGGEVLCDMDLLHAGVCVGLCRDPNLWVVKCRMGEEKAVVVHLMRKVIAYQFSEEVGVVYLPGHKYSSQSCYKDTNIFLCNFALASQLMQFSSACLHCLVQRNMLQ